MVNSVPGVYEIKAHKMVSKRDLYNKNNFLSANGYITIAVDDKISQKKNFSSQNLFS